MSDSPSRDIPFRQGDVVAGKYRVLRVIGAGAMGVVLAAHHEQLGHKVALKVLLPGLLTNDEAVARFAVEARAVARLTTEYVARVLDVGRLEDGSPYMVMEYLEGEDLAARLERTGPLPVAEAVDFVMQACVALAEAHGRGIVHRDLKPANLFWTRRPDGPATIKVLDFGISKVTSPGAHAGLAQLAITKKFDVIGSPLYMSPEQMKASRHVDAQSDVWGLGVILFELLTAQLPFTGESETDVAINVASKPPRPLTDLRTDVPPGLVAVVQMCLAKDKADRILDVAELAAALAPFAPPHAAPLVDRVARTLEASLAAAAETDLLEAAIEPAELALPPGLQLLPSATDRGAITLLGQSRAMASSLPGAKRSRRGLVVAIAAGLLAVSFTVVFFLIPPGAARVDATARDTSAASVVAVSPSAVAPALAPASPSSWVAEPVAASAARTDVTLEPLVALPPSRPVRAPVTATPSPRPPRPARPVSQARPTADCDVPYTLDEEGRKHFRPECFPKN